MASEVGGLAVVADQSVEADCLRVVEQTIETYGRLDALVVNAGVEAFGSAEEVALDDWASVMKVNVDGPLLMARAAAPDLRANRGSIVLVSSVAGLAAGPKYAAYVTSKTAVLGVARSLAVDLGSSGDRVNALCPGWVDTDMSRREVEELATAIDSDPSGPWANSPKSHLA